MQIAVGFVTMLFGLHVNKEDSVLLSVEWAFTFRMVKQRRQSGTSLKVRANNFFMPKQGGPVPFTFHFGRMPKEPRLHYTQHPSNP